MLACCMFNVRGEGEVVCWKKTMPIDVEGWGEKGEIINKNEDDFCQKEDSFSFCNQNFFYGIQYQGPRTYSMDNHPSNQFADTSTELPRKNARKNQSDVSSSVDFRDNCPSALHEMPVYCPVKVGWWSSHEVWWTVVRSVGLGMFSSYVRGVQWAS